MNPLRKTDNQIHLKEVWPLISLCLRKWVLSLLVVAGLLLGLNPVTGGSVTVYAEEAAGEDAGDVEGADDADDDEDDLEEEEPVPAKISEMNLRQLKSYQRFVYISGSRDPLTFRKPPDVGPDQDRKGTGGGVPPTIPGKRPKTKEQLKYLLEVLAKLDFYLKLHEYKQAYGESAEAIKEVEEKWKGVEPNNDLLRQIYERIKSLDRTARRLQQAKETREEFETLQLIIRGILWTPKGSRTLINGKSYEPGQVIEGLKLDEGAQVQIEEIDEFSVVFIFKGLRFRKNVGETVKK